MGLYYNPIDVTIVSTYELDCLLPIRSRFLVSMILSDGNVVPFVLVNLKVSVQLLAPKEVCFLLFGLLCQHI